MWAFGEKPSCPYCRATLESRPKRKKKCPHCGSYMFVRGGEVVTDEEAAIRDWLDAVAEFAITREKFDRKREELSSRFGTRASVNDTAWGLLNALVGRVDDSTLQFVYWQMARLVSEEGKDPKRYLRQALQQQLLSLRRSGVGMVDTSDCNDPFVCSACKALRGKRWTIEEALSKMPIPDSCTEPSGCRCGYCPLPDPIEPP